MLPIDRSPLRAIESTLAVLVLVIITVMATDFPIQYPTSVTLGSVPLYPQLVVPGTLGLVVLLKEVADGLSVRTVAVGVLSTTTLLLAAVSLYALYTDTAGGAFGGGILTLTIGVPLAVVVLVRRTVREIVYNNTRAKTGS